MTTLRKSLARHMFVFSAAIVPTAAGAGLVCPPAATAGPDTASPSGVAGCQITVSVRNTGSKTFTVDWEKSKMRSMAQKIGAPVWTSLGNNARAEVKPGATASIELSAALGCSMSRRYQINTRADTSEKMTYHPSADGWVKGSSVTINIAH